VVLVIRTGGEIYPGVLRVWNLKLAWRFSTQNGDDNRPLINLRNTAPSFRRSELGVERRSLRYETADGFVLSQRNGDYTAMWNVGAFP
jgi:hypothetical protein